MKAITLHPTANADLSLDSKERRTTSSNNGETGSAIISGGTNGNNPSTGISGLGNIDATVHHYELPNLA
jgi:hypothetical protein